MLSGFEGYHLAAPLSRLKTFSQVCMCVNVWLTLVYCNLYLPAGINIVHGGITIQKEIDGRETGEAFVELVSKDDVDKALARDRKEIQHRYYCMHENDFWVVCS